MEQLSFWLTHARMKRLTPRRRGEHTGKVRLSYCHLGSSPQARGARLLLLALPRVRGLIPAGAGSTLYSNWYCCTIPAHPRRRGEHAEL